MYGGIRGLLPIPFQEDQIRSEKFCVGDIWNGINRKENFRKIREATREKISPPECINVNMNRVAPIV
jgi:hypothetical protein